MLLNNEWLAARFEVFPAKGEDDNDPAQGAADFDVFGRLETGKADPQALQSPPRPVKVRTEVAK